jgi:hypothetical protein
VIDLGNTSDLPPDTFDLDGNGVITEPLPLDLSARSRQIGFTTVSPRVDMGAYEATILDVLADAGALLDEGTEFRSSYLQLLPANSMAEALQNYATFNDGEYFKAFCADYDAIDAGGYCPEDAEGMNIRNGLVEAITLYLVARYYPTAEWTTHDGEVIPVHELGGTGVIAAARETANVHLIFGNEFLIDAIDYRFSLEGIPYADEIILKELEELGQAKQQFALTVDLLFRLLDASEWDGSEYLTSDDFETFGVASNRMMMALEEMAARHYMQGESELALAVFDEAYE